MKLEQEEFYVKLTEHRSNFAVTYIIQGCNVDPGHVWKLQKFTFTHFWQKFRESNDYTKQITKELI